MDPVTHTIAGAAAAILVTADTSGLHPLVPIAAGVVASVTPDFDFITKKLSQAAFLKHHHGITHSVFTITLQGALVALLFSLVFGLQFYIHLLFACLAAEATHLILDMVLHSNGIALFSPISEKRYSLPILLGLNPITSLAACHKQSIFVCLICQLNSAIRNPMPLALITALLMSVFDFANARLYAALAFGFVLLWYLLAYTARHLAGSKLSALPKWKEWRLMGAYPAGFYLLRWLGVFRKGNEYTTVTVQLGNVETIGEHNHGASGVGEFLETTKASSMRETFEIAAYVPFEEQIATADGYKIRWVDLSHALSPDFDLFSVHVHLDSQGNVLRSAFRERWNPEIED